MTFVQHVIRRVGCALTAGVALAAVIAPAAQAERGVQRLKYRVGPVTVTPGQNRIAYRVLEDKPPVDGYITRIKANLVRADGTVPPSSEVMFHHGVWLNLSRPD